MTIKAQLEQEHQAAVDALLAECQRLRHPLERYEAELCASVVLAAVENVRMLRAFDEIAGPRAAA